MTVLEAIVEVDSKKKNTFSKHEKIRWLNELDGRIKTDLVDTHESGCSCDWSGYSDDDDHAELIAAAPHDCIYKWWLFAMIDLESGELHRYNEDISLFNSAYDRFSKWFVRTHKPKQYAITYY